MNNQHQCLHPCAIGVPLAIGGIILLIGAVAALHWEMPLFNPFAICGTALFIIGLLQTVSPYVSGRRVVDFLGWLLINVSAYLILWLLHCVSTNLDASDLRYIGNGQSVWPIEVVPWIVIFITILNLATLGIAILSRK